jgi:chemotaxis response regulator CheB
MVSPTPPKRRTVKRAAKVPASAPQALIHPPLPARQPPSPSSALAPRPAGSSGLAYVVVQHLDPNHKGIMVELLQRATAMPVVQITDRLGVEPNHVYVIPPNRDLSILHGVLHLLEPEAPRGLRLPIDFFLRALAADQQERAIGVILSGMGSDGTLGLRAIKENAGAVFVQDPASAKFDGMPRSAIDAGLADIVAPPKNSPSASSATSTTCRCSSPRPLST